MSIQAYSKVEKDNRKEFGYGLYVNAYIVDDELAVPEAGIDGEQGMYASECVPFDATDKLLSQASRRVCRTAIRRYKKEKANV